MWLPHKLMTRLRTQRNMSPHLGALINIYQTTAVFYAPLTFIGVATTVFGLWGMEIVRSHLPWFTVYHLLGCMAGLILALMVFSYKVIIPSIVAFSVQQQYKHRNPMVTDLKVILRNQKAILEELRRVGERLDKLEKEKNKG